MSELKPVHMCSLTIHVVKFIMPTEYLTLAQPNLQTATLDKTDHSQLEEPYYYQGDPNCPSLALNTQKWLF